MGHRKYTIFLPVHNGGDYVKECVASILGQRRGDFDLVVLENASTDGTNEWLGTLTDPRIILCASAQLLPIEQNWARALAMPKNEFMTFIGHDDLLDANYLEAMDQLIARHPDARLYHTHFRYIDEKGRTRRSCRPLPARETAAEYLLALFSARRDTYGTGYLYRSTHYQEVGGIPTWDHLLFADDALWMRLMSGGWKATAGEECFAVRNHPQSYGQRASWQSWANAIRHYHRFLTSLAENDRRFRDALQQHAPQYFFSWSCLLYARIRNEARNQSRPINSADTRQLVALLNDVAPDRESQFIKYINRPPLPLSQTACVQRLYTIYHRLRYGFPPDF